MAITINNTPDIHQSFHEDLWHVVTSDNVAQTNFKYVFDVHIAGLGLVARIKLFPQPGTNKGVFNAAPIIRNYWSSYFQPSGTQAAFNYIGSGNTLNYEIYYGEEYDGTLYTNLQTTDNFAINYYPSVTVGRSAFDGTWYQGQYLGYLLTKRDKTQLQTNQTGNRLFISLQNSEVNVPYDWQIEVTRNNGGTTSIGSIRTINYIGVLDISPTAINNYLGTSFITSATDSYIVRTFNDTIGDYTDEVTVTKICQPRHNHIPLHFLNSVGGYDTMIFTLVNRENRSVERKSFEQAEWQYRSTDMYRWNQYNVFNGGAVQFNTQQSITYKLTSDWLRDLIMSPEVYMELNSGEFIPVKITTSQWNQKKRYVDKVYNLELDIELGSKEFSQYR